MHYAPYNSPVPCPNKPDHLRKLLLASPPTVQWWTVVRIADYGWKKRNTTNQPPRLVVGCKSNGRFVFPLSARMSQEHSRADLTPFSPFFPFLFELLKIVEAIIKRGVALFGLPPTTFVVAINELRQIIVNIHILSF